CIVVAVVARMPQDDLEQLSQPDREPEHGDAIDRPLRIAGPRPPGRAGYLRRHHASIPPDEILLFFVGLARARQPDGFMPDSSKARKCMWQKSLCFSRLSRTS